MNRSEALALMKAPMDKRPVCRGGVLQIKVTGACDKSCFGCTQGSNLRHPGDPISLEHFEQACQSLEGYFGVVGIFGGNPALHPQFTEICELASQYFPKEQLGLWCNKPFGKAGLMRKTFNPAVSNINVHLDKDAEAEFKRDWPEVPLVGTTVDSQHSPTFVSMKDVGVEESERWELISKCDVNQFWSAMIATFRGQLRGWFCEIAGSQSILNENNPKYPDTGLEVEYGWWNQGINAFGQQIDFHCHDCGIPLRGHGELAIGGATEQVSQKYVGVYKPKPKDRLVQLVTDREQLKEQSHNRATDYIGNK